MKKVILMNKLTVKEIKALLDQITVIEDPRLQEIRKDDRK